MKLLYKIFRQDSQSREGIITTTSGLGIIVNLLIAAIKIIIGAAVSSIAIVSEGVNNASDAATSVLTVVGAKLSAKRPTRKHPFGYGRIEYLTSLVVAVLILITGAEMMISSVKLIMAPTQLSISYITLAIVAASALAKFALGVYTMKTGKRINSAVLVALGADSRNDSFASIVTILSSVVFLIFNYSIDAYAGIFTSVIILKSGFDVLRDTVGDLIGKAGERELAARLYKEIRGTDGVLNAVDMMLHNYGPDAYSGSVNIEIDHEKTVGEVYAVLHELQLRIMHEYNVTMVFGIYAVDADHEDVREMRKTIADFVHRQEHVLGYHALYVEPDSGTIYCDFIVDYDQRDWEALSDQFKQYMAERYPGHAIELTVETEYV